MTSISPTTFDVAVADYASPQPAKPKPTAAQGEVKEAFTDFVGQTFYGQMLKALRQSVGKAPYFDGGQTEEIFRNQLDQVLSEKLSEASADTFSGPMFELFQLNRR